MAGFFSRLFGRGKKQTAPTPQENNVSKPSVQTPQMPPQGHPDTLLLRASPNFNKYLTDFLQKGSSVGFPMARLSREEWDEVNKKLEKHGVVLVLRDGAMWFDYASATGTSADNSVSLLEKLKKRASSNFEKYMAEFLHGGGDTLLPWGRMSDSDWNELNRLIADRGVCLVPTVHRGVQYMRFSRIEREDRSAVSNDNTAAFHAGVGAVKVKAFDQIKQQYPNLSDEVVQYLVDNNDKLSETDVYEIIRHARRPYDTPQSQFIEATKYGSQHTNDIMVLSYQNWTWSRVARRRMRQSGSCEYHLSLNVHVTPGLIAALDDVLARDMGQHISYYKFPKVNWFDEIQYRHDPVTIYMYDRDADTEQQIVAAVAPYVRSNEGLLGQVLGPGVDINVETSNGGGLSVGQSIAVKIKKILDSARE